MTTHRLSRLRAAAALRALAPILLLTASAVARQTPSVKLSTPEQFKEEFAAVPCKNDERFAAVKALLEGAGVPASDMSTDKYKDVENLVAVKKGESEERIVVGAHYDKVSEGCGAVDNWTGVVTLAHLYTTLKDVPLKKTLVFVAFGKEEKGLVGSRAMAKAIDKEQAAHYCAMINIDSLGLGPPQVAENMSTGKMRGLAAALAKEMKMPFGSAGIAGADSDSSPFVSKHSKDWASVLHSRGDQPSKVNPLSVYLGYRLALALIVRVDASPCSAYR
jgi:acetylornithine deacetylase/succinyl-diaminopimelate desuccinylase-like protein